MIVYVSGKNGFVVTDDIKAHFDEKIKKVTKLFTKDSVDEIRCGIKILEDKSFKIETSIFVKGVQIRNEEKSKEVLTGITKSINKIFIQIKNYKDKISSNSKLKGQKAIFKGVPTPGEVDLVLERTKSVDLEPISFQDAILNMELLGHSFYIYLDKNTNKVSLIYKTSKSKYSVIETSVH
jgi:putative sigma-54 modulation protein